MVLSHLSPAIKLVLQVVMKLHLSAVRKVVNPRIDTIMHVNAFLPPLAPVDAQTLLVQTDRYRETNRNWLKMKLKLDNVNKRFKRFKGLFKV